jgi:hypothetical protein
LLNEFALATGGNGGGNFPFASYLRALLSRTGQLRNRLLSEAKPPFSAVVQMVGFGLGKSKMPYLLKGVA